MSQITAYKYDTFGLLLRLKDTQGSDIDIAATYDEVRFRVLEPYVDSDPVIELTWQADGDFSLQNTNELVAEIADTEMEQLAATAYRYDIQFTLKNGAKRSIDPDKFVVTNVFSDQAGTDATFDLTVSDQSDSLELTLGD